MILPKAPAMKTSYHQIAIAQLCEHLRPLYEAELAAGNELDYAQTDIAGTGSVLVKLSKTFRAPPVEPSPLVAYREINDPDRWKAEYCCLEDSHTVACGFDES